MATTIETIAGKAAVAPATVYQAFGSKRAVLAAALDVAIAGDTEPLAVLERAWVQAARRESDPVQRLVRVVDHTTEIAERSTAIKEVIRDAVALEPDLRELISQDEERRYRTQQALVAVILSDQPVGSAQLQDATDALFALVNSDSYSLLVDRRGRSMAAWRRWLVRILCREILDSTAPGTS